MIGVKSILPRYDSEHYTVAQLNVIISAKRILIEL